MFAEYGTQPLFPLLRVLRSATDRYAPEDPHLRETCLYLREMLTQGELCLRVLVGAFKLGMYFVVRRQLESGRLAFYMRKVRVLHEDIHEEWKSFEAKLPPE
jgi:hypothetical protein